MYYEHTPFHCRKCHEHGHLFHDCPLNAQNSKVGDEKKKDVYTTVTGRKNNPLERQIKGETRNSPSTNLLIS
jgi:hypothetical protein